MEWLDLCENEPEFNRPIIFRCIKNNGNTAGVVLHNQKFKETIYCEMGIYVSKYVENEDELSRNTVFIMKGIQEVNKDKLCQFKISSWRADNEKYSFSYLDNKTEN